MRSPIRALKLSRLLTVALMAAAMCMSLLTLPGSAAAGGVPRLINTFTSFDAATQSHPGACSQSTVDVSHAVTDLSANGILGKYAAIVGVHATGPALVSEMGNKLVVAQVAQTTTTSNHGCTTDGIIFPSGSRTLTQGEMVGVALPASLRSRLCTGSTAGCERATLTFKTVFPTNCWNLDQGNVKVVVYLRAEAKAKSRIAKPSASFSTACGAAGAGTSTVTLANAAGATEAATFELNGKSYGPLASGKSLKVVIALQTGSDVEIKVTSGGDTLVDGSVPPDPCSTSSTTTASPSASAQFSCSAGGVVVTLANAATATADASFTVNGTSYGPLAPGATLQVKVSVAQSQTETVTVVSGGHTLLTSVSYSNSCAAAPSALATQYCSAVDGGGGTLAVSLGDGPAADLPITFDLSVSGNTTTGYGPATVGPIKVGATETLLLPIDGSGNPITVTATAGSYSYQVTLPGCPFVPEDG